MTEDFDGERIARERTAQEAQRRTGFLDLSRLGLTDLPAGLFALTLVRLSAPQGGQNRLARRVQSVRADGDFAHPDWRLSARFLRSARVPSPAAFFTPWGEGGVRDRGA